MGATGKVTELLVARLASGPPLSYIYACGPQGMLAALQKIAAQKKLAGQVSLEKRMACGVGACLGCAVAMKDKTTGFACRDGPVFDILEVNFDE